MSGYGWIITHDLLGDEPEAVGVMGPRNITEELKRRLQAGEGQAFRLLDDDREPYYAGRWIVTEAGDAEGDPLADYGEPNAGCTIMQVREGGRWEDLIS